MSKQCPYFKFYSDEWNSGLITVEPMEAQGLFINICSLLWSKGELTEEHFLKRFSSKCQADAKQLLSQLVADGIICLANGKIEVKFITNNKKEEEEYKKNQAQKGQLGGIAKAKKSSTCQADAKQLLSRPEIFSSTCQNKENIIEKEKKNSPTPPYKEKKKDNTKEISISSNDIVEKIYLQYPRHEAKGNALKAIEKALTKINADDLLAKVQEYSTKIQWKDKQFIPLPATWFNQERWNDDPKNWERDIPKPAFKEIPDTNLREELFL